MTYWERFQYNIYRLLGNRPPEYPEEGSQLDQPTSSTWGEMFEGGGKGFIKKAKKGTQDAFKSIKSKIPPVIKSHRSATFQAFVTPGDEGSPREAREALEDPVKWRRSGLFSDSSNSSAGVDTDPPQESNDSTHSNHVSTSQPIKSILASDTTNRIKDTATLGSSVSAFQPPAASGSAPGNGTLGKQTRSAFAPTVHFADGGQLEPTPIVFLQYRGETKRATVREEDKSAEGVRALFVRTFLNLTSFDVTQPGVKIYIQDADKLDLFYELEQFEEIRDRSVLRLHDPAAAGEGPLSSALGLRQPISGVAKNPNPSASFNHLDDDANYFSEPEFELDNFGRRKRLGFNSGYTSNPAPSNPYQSAFSSERRFATLDNRGLRSTSSQPPPKPQRFAPITTLPTSQSMVQSTSASGGSGQATQFRNSYVPPAPSSMTSSTSSWITDPPVPHPSVHPHDPTLFQPLSHSSSSFSDRSNSLPRSGSVTPVIDEETRVRMDHMESQLGDLSKLVQTALMTQAANTKSLNSEVYRDIQALRRDIFSDDQGSESGSVSRFSDVSSDKASLTTNEREAMLYPAGLVNSSIKDVIIPGGGGVGSSPVAVNPEMRRSIRQARRRCRELQSEMRQLRRTAQLNAQTSRTLLRDAFDKIKFILNTNKQLHVFADSAQQANQQSLLASDRVWADQEQARWKATMTALEGDASLLDREIEDLRHKVVSGQKRLRISQVEKFARNLTNIGTSAAELKSQFPNLQYRLKDVMGSEMEKVVREERFLKEEPERIDSILRKCEKLAATMKTMKKLAYVQDPTAPLLGSTIGSGPSLQASQSSNGHVVQSGSSTSYSNKTSNGFVPGFGGGLMKSRSGSHITSTGFSGAGLQLRGSGHQRSGGSLSGSPPNVTTRSDSYDATATRRIIGSSTSRDTPVDRRGNQSNGSVLDNILDELRSVTKPSGYPLSTGVGGTANRYSNEQGLAEDNDRNRGLTPSSVGSVKFGGTTTIPVTPIGSPRSPNTVQSEAGIAERRSPFPIADSTSTYHEPVRSRYFQQQIHQQPMSGLSLVTRSQSEARIPSRFGGYSSGGPLTNGHDSNRSMTIQPSLDSRNDLGVGHPPVQSIGRSRSSMSPGPGFAARMLEATNIFGRSRSTTPNSVSSEPVSAGGLFFTGRKPPAPPPRSSSRTGFRSPMSAYPDPPSFSGENGSGSTDPPSKPPPFAKFSDSEIANMKQQFLADYQQFMNVAGGGGSRPLSHRANSQTPTPSVQTNVLDDHPLLKASNSNIKSASSSESVNSQDGIPPGRPPPPYPPPPAQYL